jgi:hypothetical protein
MAFTVFADVAVVAELETFPDVEIVPSFVPAIAAEAFIIAFVITPEPITVDPCVPVTFPESVPVKLVEDVDVDAFPIKSAVIVPAEKFPEPSRKTIVLAVLVDTAVVAAFETFPALTIVASFVSAIAAEGETSALTTKLDEKTPPAELWTMPAVRKRGIVIVCALNPIPLIVPPVIDTLLEF